MDSTTRRCPRCDEDRPLEQFQPRRGRLGQPSVGGYCNACHVTYQAEYRAANRERLRAHKRAAAETARRDGMVLLGGRCACCGEDEPIFLTLDHVEGREPGDRDTGIKAWARAARRDFAGYQLLCWNCNSGRAINGGVCPHQALVTA